MARRTVKTKATKKDKNYLQQIEEEITTSQSKISLFLGALIILVIGILIYNYFNRDKTPEVGPSDQTQIQTEGDVSPENLPGKYTVKEGDTLFLIAEKYYKDGFKYEEIVKANNLTSPDALEVGQVLEIPKVELTPLASASAEPTFIPTESLTPTPLPEPTVTTAPQTDGISEPSAQYGEPITGNKYTVQEGDWLSTIASRAYGDVYAFEKIAKANNIANPDYIVPGMELTIPR